MPVCYNIWIISVNNICQSSAPFFPHLWYTWITQNSAPFQLWTMRSDLEVQNVPPAALHLAAHCPSTSWRSLFSEEPHCQKNNITPKFKDSGYQNPVPYYILSTLAYAVQKLMNKSPGEVTYCPILYNPQTPLQVQERHVESFVNTHAPSNILKRGPVFHDQEGNHIVRPESEVDLKDGLFSPVVCTSQGSRVWYP